MVIEEVRALHARRCSGVAFNVEVPYAGGVDGREALREGDVLRE